jgi:hypothetical protein
MSKYNAYSVLALFVNSIVLRIVRFEYQLALESEMTLGYALWLYERIWCRTVASA